MNEADIIKLAQQVMDSSKTSILVDADTLNIIITDPSSIFCGATVLWLIVFCFNRSDFLTVLAQQSPYTLSDCLLDQAPAGRPSILWHMATTQPNILVLLAQTSDFLDYIKTLDLNAAYNGTSIFVSLLTSHDGRTLLMQCPAVLFKANFNEEVTFKIKQYWYFNQFLHNEAFLKLLILVDINFNVDPTNKLDLYCYDLKQKLNNQISTWVNQLTLQYQHIITTNLLIPAQVLLEKIIGLYPDLTFLDTEFTSYLIQKHSSDDPLGTLLSNLNI